MLKEIILETLIDSLKILPFLFVAYLAIELIEHKVEEKTIAFVHKAGRLGPVVGALLGVIPQCGFSAATSNLYAGGIVSLGTLLAVFLSTSDEMLPILIASPEANTALILKIIGFKCLAGILAGVLVDTVLLWRGKHRDKHIHELCEKEGCRCEDGVLKSALRHTIKIFLFLLLTSFVINLAVGFLGEERLASFILNKPILGELLSGIIGLLPNCAASIVITQLYLEGGMSAGAMLSGLLVSAGVGMLVLFRMNRNLKENLMVLGLLYAFGVVFGLLGGLLPIF